MSTVAALATISAIAAIAGGVYLEMARVGALMTLLALTFVELRGGRKRFMTSPLFFLSAIGVVFFSLLQGFWGGKARPDLATFVGSQAEGVILAFCMTSLVFYVLASRENLIKPLLKTMLPKKLALPLFVLAATVSCFDIAVYSLNSLQVSIPPIIGEAHFVAPPLISLCLCLLVRGAPARGRNFQLAVFLLVIATLGGLTYVREGKIVMFMLVAVSLYAIRVFDLSFSHILLALLAALLIALAFGAAIQQTRWMVWAGPNPTSAIYYQNIQSKAVWRQTETGYCFGNVLKAHAHEPFVAKQQLFWIKGLVPRALWPEKPSLSLGKEYAVDYCSKKPRYVGTHSSSITLLGQPVIHGGIVGLIFHAGLLLFGLAAMERFNANPAKLPSAMVAALLPWLIDFDQDFAIYVANAVKFALVMAVLFIPVAVIERCAFGLGQERKRF